MVWGPLVSGRLIRRLNRFAVSVALDDGTETLAHLPNSGRLEEVLKPHNRCWLNPKPALKRVTPYDLLLCTDGATLVSIDARLPPILLSEAIESGRIPFFGRPRFIQKEVPAAGHRLDLLVETNRGRFWVETKSVTLVVNGVALFPDAPTERGRRHLLVLRDLARSGERAVVFFVVQRSDPQFLSPNASADPAFAQTLRQVARSGVTVRAVACDVTLSGASVVRPLPVCFSSP